jgi:ligand-binding sensor domain-containing protein
MVNRLQLQPSLIDGYCLPLLQASNSNGQFSSLRFRNINSQNGLSHNTVTCIGQDTLGFMWFGTFNGVNRFDGHDFKHYEADAKNKTGLTISRAINIYTDTSGSLWVRTIDSTLHKYNYDTDDFTRYGNKEVPTEVHQAMQRQQGEETYAYKNHHFRFQREKVRWFTYTDSSSGHTRRTMSSTTTILTVSKTVTSSAYSLTVITIYG